MNVDVTSPVVDVFDALRAANPRWHIAIGNPGTEDGWIPGTAFRTPDAGPFGELLTRMQARLATPDRMTVAASFALRFGWAASVAIAPYLLHRCVPDISLDNISVKFRVDTLFERTAVHVPRGTMLRSEASRHSCIETVASDEALRARLRQALFEQTQPVVDALRKWSGFAPKGTWGQITSSWASQFIAVYERRGCQADAKPVIEAFFAGSDDVARMQPALHPVTLGEVTHLYQRRASCCRFYLLPGKDLCASCPLVSHDDRVARNLAFMKKMLAR